MAATKGFITGAATSALDARKADEFKLAHSAAGAPRIGVLTTNPSIVTADASTSPMRVAVAKAGFATQRDANDGVAFWGNDGSVFVTIGAAPISNSRIDVVWAKHNDTTKGDADNVPTIGVTAGTAAASPAKPAIPSGALELATVLVPAGATATTSGGVIITNTYPMTAMRGGLLRFRTATERDAFIAPAGDQAILLSDGLRWTSSGTAWVDESTPVIVPLTVNGANWSATAGYVPYLRVLGRRRELVGAMTRALGGTTSDILLIPAGHRPAANVFLQAALTSGDTYFQPFVEGPSGLVKIAYGNSTGVGAYPFNGHWYV